METNQLSAEQGHMPAAELSKLVRLALPILTAQLAQMAMVLVDTAMAGRVSAVDLAGVALGGALMWPVMMFVMGVLQAVTPTVSHLNGADRQREVGEVIRQALWLAALGAALLIAFVLNAESVYALMVVDPAAIPVSVGYLAATAWGIPALMGYFVLRFLCEGLGFTRPAMFIAVSALVVKIPLNYVFIYGAFGLPAMGGVGCGVATAIVIWVELGLILLVASRPRFQLTGWQRRFSWPDWQMMARLMGIGIPIGATMFFEMGLFAVVALLLGRFGADVVAAHTIAINLGGVTFMFPLALGMAATIRVGFNVGAGKYEAAAYVAKLAVGLTLGVAVLLGIFVAVARHSIAALYSTDAQVVGLAASLMMFVAVFQLFDSAQATTIGALRGYKDTRVPMAITLVGYWCVGLPVALTLGYGWLGAPMGAYGFWIGLTVALMFVAASVLSRLWWLRRNPSVIVSLAHR
jgi:multidrug resistance protein, MATE family